MRDHPLGADPRWLAPDMRRRIPGLQPAPAGLGLPADVPRTGIDIVGFEPAVVAVPSECADIAGWHIGPAIAALRLGTRDCNNGFEGGSDERASHIPGADTFCAEADEPLDGRPICEKLVLGPRKRLTSDGQASDAESNAPLRGAS